MEIERYKHLNKYLKNKFGERTLKICIDGGFTCPNRDGTISTNGCIFCSNKGSGEHIENFMKKHSSEENIFSSDCTILKIQLQSIKTQISNFFNSYKSERANKFIAYFQNFTNTYDSIENLKAKYNSAIFG